MNIIVEVTLATGTSVSSCRAVYYSATDHTVVWRRVGNEDVALLDHAGSPEQYRLPGRNTFGAPMGSDVLTYREDGCACGHFYKRYTPPDPITTLGHAWREHAR
jgi:hypothetical protein